MHSMDPGIPMLVRLEQPKKASMSMLLRPLPRSTEDRLVHSAKALSPMKSILSGIVTLTRLEHPLKAASEIYVTGSPSISFFSGLWLFPCLHYKHIVYNLFYLHSKLFHPRQLFQTVGRLSDIQSCHREILILYQDLSILPR